MSSIVIYTFRVIIILVNRMERAILLQINPTTVKRIKLLDFERKATELANLIAGKKITLYEFHNSTLYREYKDSTGFNTQVVTAISRVAVKTKGTIIKHMTVKFNVPRNCKSFSTKTMTFVKLGMYPRKTTAVPIIKNRNWQRYDALLNNGWNCKTYGLTSDLQIVAYLSKPDPVGTVYSDKKKQTKIQRLGQPNIGKNIMGIDFNAKRIAVTIISPRTGFFIKTTLVWIYGLERRGFWKGVPRCRLPIIPKDCED